MTVNECQEAKAHGTPVYLVSIEHGICHGTIVTVHEEEKSCLVGSFVTVQLTDGQEISRFAREIALTEEGAKETQAWQIRQITKTLEQSIETKDDLIRFLFRETMNRNPLVRQAMIHFARDKFQIRLP